MLCRPGDDELVGAGRVTGPSDDGNRGSRGDPAICRRLARRQPGRDVLAGTGTLVGFSLGRERIKLPLWLLGMPALLSVFVSAVSELTATE